MLNHPTDDNCPNCGKKVIESCEPAYQEYPGASAQGGYTSRSCTACDWYDVQKHDLRDFNYVENRRGW